MAEANIPAFDSLTQETKQTETETGDNRNMESSDAADATDGMNRFLQKTRSELMSELSSIQHNDRPVTGSDYRVNIDKFFAKHQQTPAGAEGKSNVPANVDNVEEHRPESIVVEVQGLYEQQRVSSILQSPAFLRSLNRIIRGNISRTPAPVVHNRGRTPAPVIPSRGRASTPPVPETESRTDPSVNVHEDAVSDAASVSSRSSAASSISSAHVSVAPLEGIPVVDNEENIGVWRPSELSTYDISDVRHDDMVQEINELLHNRLVTTTLEGEFRGTLEVQLQNVVTALGLDGSNVNLRNLPHGTHTRNDFRHLGLGQPTMDNWDNISVTSINATAVPYSQSNLLLSREISSLRTQMEEMKNMLKMTFDIQLDIQRAIRQEVAAAISQASVPGGATCLPLASHTQPVNDTHCLICLDNHADTVLYQCGHLCLCYACGNHLMERSGKCPVCRAPIKDIIRTYKCNQD